MHPQPPIRDIPSKTKSEPEVAKLSRYEPPIDAPAPETKKISKPTSSKKTSQLKVVILFKQAVNKYTSFGSCFFFFL